MVGVHGQGWQYNESLAPLELLVRREEDDGGNGAGAGVGVGWAGARSGIAKSIW